MAELDHHDVKPVDTIRLKVGEGGDFIDGTKMHAGEISDYPKAVKKEIDRRNKSGVVFHSQRDRPEGQEPGINVAITKQADVEPVLGIDPKHRSRLEVTDRREWGHAPAKSMLSANKMSSASKEKFLSGRRPKSPDRS